MPERRTWRFVIAAPVAVATLLSAQAAWAALDDSAAASASYSTAVLSPPTGLAAAVGICTLGNGDRIALSWTATASGWATGYEIARSTSAGGPFSVVATVTGISTTSYTDGPLAFSTTFYYAVRSTKSAWRSVDATASKKTRSSLCV